MIVFIHQTVRRLSFPLALSLSLSPLVFSLRPRLLNPSFVNDSAVRLMVMSAHIHYLPPFDSHPVLITKLPIPQLSNSVRMDRHVSGAPVLFSVVFHRLYRSLELDADGSKCSYSESRRCERNVSLNSLRFPT